MSSGWIDTLIGGGLAITGGFVSSWWQTKLTADREARQLAKAIKGELTGILEIAKVRQYEKGIEAALNHVRATSQPFIFSVTVRGDYTAVYRENAGRLGLLKGELPATISVVYTKIFSILEDFHLLTEIQGKPDRHHEMDLGRCLEMYEELLELLRQTLAQGQAVIDEIGVLYPK
ncbi:hypothetical protein [Hydrogenophaga sp.]|uniref:hypothetical protein n=1 Tax=Hydrogenophaga sp. TaxID=1904254 RepID=UPI0027366A43|nr:hypothetical protein [Hydrogenophaga sp.]MDP3106960.1 hypothetical protein [Hydrogenophaga sp.]